MCPGHPKHPSRTAAPGAAKKTEPHDLLSSGHRAQYDLAMLGPREDLMMRRAVPDDAEALAQLHVDVWEDAYRGLMPDHVFMEPRASLSQRADGWRRNIAESPAATTVVTDGVSLLGFASIGPGRDDDLEIADEVWALYLRGSWWGRGVGHELLATTLADRSAYLWVLDGNERAIGFYRQHGFAADGAQRQDEYGYELRMIR